MNAMKHWAKPYRAYSVRISSDPADYGSECSQADAERISRTLAKLVSARYPGVDIRNGGRAVAGPDANVCDEIREWIDANWSKAL